MNAFEKEIIEALKEAAIEYQTFCKEEDDEDWSFKECAEQCEEVVMESVHCIIKNYLASL